MLWSAALNISFSFFYNSYYKNSLSKEQLEVIVAELQRKVKMLQQRHRRHLDKLLGLENTVSQLRQSNLLNEERLQLLERVRSSERHHRICAAHFRWYGAVFICGNCILTFSCLLSCVSGIHADRRSGVRCWWDRGHHLWGGWRCISLHATEREAVRPNWLRTSHLLVSICCQMCQNNNTVDNISFLTKCYLPFLFFLN